MAAILTKGKLQLASTFAVGYPAVRPEYATKPLGTDACSFRLTLAGAIPPTARTRRPDCQFLQSQHQTTLKPASKEI